MPFILLSVFYLFISGYKCDIVYVSNILLCDFMILLTTYSLY